VVNEYEDSGIRPFHLAPGTLTMSSYQKILKPTVPTPPPGQEDGDSKAAGK